MYNQHKRKTIDREVKKQLNEMDEKFERSGWFYIVLVIILLFIGIFIFMWLNNEVHEPKSLTVDEMTQKIHLLEEKVDSLESRLLEIE